MTNRWKDSFQNHAFQKPWKEIVELSKQLHLQDETITTDVQELARLRKVVIYIAHLIEASDPELVPQSVWDNFNGQSQPCLDQINQYISNKIIAHLNQANNHLDNLLSYIRPYVVSEKGAARAAVLGFKEYTDTVNSQISLVQTKIQDFVNITRTNKEKSDEILLEIEQSKQSIKQLEKGFLIGDANEKSLKERMSGLFDEVQGWHKAIGEFHKRLTSGNEQEGALSLQIDEAKNKAIKDGKAIDDALKSSENLLKGLKDFYDHVFGADEAEEDSEIGLKRELDNRIKELDEFKVEQNKAYSTLFQEIESLLPGATSAGLAGAYGSLRRSFSKSIRRYSLVFYFSLIFIAISGLIAITSKIGLWEIEFVDVTDPAKILIGFVHKLPILFPALWLALFASKRRSEDRRLQQEYAHKEALTKSYQSFRTQIEAMKTGQEELMQKLLVAAIDAISSNASDTLDGKHGDKIPLQELLEKILAKLPEKFPDLSRVGNEKIEQRF